jgi:hypothetical protein
MNRIKTVFKSLESENRSGAKKLARKILRKNQSLSGKRERAEE